MSQLRDLIPFVRAYIAGGRWKLLGVIVLQTVLTAITGVGLLLILPLLGLLGFGAGPSDSPIWQVLQSALNQVGLKLSLELGLGLFIAVIVLQALLEWRRATWQVDVEQQFQFSLRTKLYETLAQTEFYRLQQLRTSQFIQSTQVEIRQAQMAVNVLFRLFSQLLNLTTYFVVAMILSVQMTLFAVTCGLIVVFLLMPLVRKTHRLSRGQIKIRAKMLTNLIEHIQGVRSARVLGLTDRFADDFRQQCQEAAEGHRNLSRLSATSSLIFQVVAVLLLCVIVFIGLRYAQVEASVFVVLLIIFAKIYPAVGVLQVQIQQFVRHIPSFSHYQDLISDLASHAEAALPDKHEPPIVMRQSLALVDVGFSYQSVDGPVLGNISLTLKKGSFNAICGESGAGKSTLADITIGLLPAQQGALLIDGKTLDETGRIRWRSEVCLVPQESFLFDDTVRGNLLCVRPDASEKELWEALDIVNARRFVEAKAGGLDSLVGERGNQLSGGERQRISIARALLRRPQLLVLDEPTNNLDDESKTALLALLPGIRAKTTLLVISHDPRVLGFADSVFYLEQGKLVAGDNESNAGRVRMEPR